MKKHVTLALSLALLLPFTASAQVRIGLVASTTGVASAVARDQNEGFLLGLEQLKGTLGGQSVEIFREDDQLKPDVGVQAVQKLITKDKVQVIVGVTASNVMNAVFDRIVGAGVAFIGTNGGPAPFAGERCSKLFLSTSFQNDGPHEAMGQYAQNKGYKRILIITPNYQAGKDSIAGFKRFYKGAVVEELLPAFGQLDFSAELTQVQSNNPDAVFAFMPGAMGINFVKQYQQAGLTSKYPLLSTFTLDELTLPAVKEAATGMVTTSAWTSGATNPASRKFVNDFQEKYKRLPSLFAVQGYDAAMILDKGIRLAGNKWSQPDVLVAAIRSGTFSSVRGDISFSANGFPVQNYSAWKVVGKDGRQAFEMESIVLKNHQDAYISKCKPS